MHSTSDWDNYYKKNINNIAWRQSGWVEYCSNFFDEILSNYEGCNLLDYGCGLGDYFKCFINKKINVTGIDISSFAINRCKEQFKNQVPLREGDTPSCIDGKYDVIIFWGTVHHINPQYWEIFLSVFEEHLSDNGIFIISGWNEKTGRFHSSSEGTSEFTGLTTWAIDNIKPLLEKYFTDIKQDSIDHNKHNSIPEENSYSYYICKKKNFVSKLETNLIESIKECINAVSFFQLVKYNIESDLTTAKPDEQKSIVYFRERDEMCALFYRIINQPKVEKDIQTNLTEQIYKRNIKKNIFAFYTKGSREVIICENKDNAVFKINSFQCNEELQISKNTISKTYSDYEGIMTLEEQRQSIQNRGITKLNNFPDYQIDNSKNNEDNDLAKLFLYAFYSETEDWYFYYFVNPTYCVKDTEIGDGVLTLFCSNELAQKDIEKINTEYLKWSSALSVESFTEKIRQKSIKSAVAAIMSRNMSHNLGSHVISGTKNHITTSGYKLNDKGSAGRGVYHLFQYLQERMDYIAMITEGDRNKTLYKAPLNLKADILDIFAIDGRDKRHNKGDDNRQIKSFLLDYIVNSEKIVRDNPKQGEERKLEIMLLREKEEDGKNNLYSFSSEANGDNDTNTFNDINFSVPLGINSRHAFLTVLENYIRNSAKHNPNRTPDNNKTLVISIKVRETKKGENNKDSDGYEITIFDNKAEVIYQKTKDDPRNKAKQIKFLKDDSSLNPSDKGIKEVLISTAWLKGETDMSKFEKENSEKIFTYSEQDLKKIYDGINENLDKIEKKLFVEADENEINRLNEQIKGLKQRLEYYPTEQESALAIKFWLPKHKYVHFAKIEKMEDYDNLPSADFYAIYDKNNLRKKDEIEKIFPHAVLVSKKDEKYFIGKGDNKIDVQEETVNSPEFLEKCYNVIGYNEKTDKNICIFYKNKPDFEGEDERIIRKEESETLGKNVTSKLYIFSNHNDTPHIFATKYEGYKNAFQEMKFLEGLSGASYNYNLLLNTAIDKLKYYKIIEACDLKIAIVDERIYNKYKKITFQNTLNRSDIERVNKEIKDSGGDPQKISQSSIGILLKFLYKQGDTDRETKERGKNFVENKNQIPLSYSYNKIFPEEKKVYIYDYDHINNRLIDLDGREYDKKTAFDFISVHYSIIEDKFKKQKEDFSEKYSEFINNYIGGTTKYKHRVVHSGRGGINGADKETFITLSAIESCLEDCKYQLAQLFLNLKYNNL